MKAVGIIAEYNPCHAGHAYHLQEARKRSEADCVIVALSGNFVQRGEPALLNKQIRTQMALANGADLVIELPIWSATASAQGFAMGGVSLLDSLPNISHLCFGTESDDLTQLEKLAGILTNESSIYKEAYLRYMKQGEHAGLARAHALKEIYPSESYDMLLTPNNILALEYLISLRKLNSSMKPLQITRKGAGYHEIIKDDPVNLNQSCVHASNESFVSAEQIRHELLGNAEQIRHELSSKNEKQITIATKLKQQLGEASFQILRNHCYPIFPDDLSLVLQYRLLQEDNFTAYPDVDSDLSNRIIKIMRQGTVVSYSGMIECLKTKNNTYTHISRSLLHILCNMKKETMPDEDTYRNGFPYLHILGMNQIGREYLHEAKKQIQAPLLTECSDAGKLLSPKAMELFEQDFYATRLYQMILHHKYGITIPDEYRSKIIIQ